MNSFSPASGPAGTLVIIDGTDLDNPIELKIAGHPAIVVSKSATKLVGLVMPGAGNGQITVTTSGGTGSSTGSFTVSAPTYASYQAGGKITGSNMVDYTNMGKSLSISADGNTAAVGGHNDTNLMGAVWIFTRSGSNWLQQGIKLLPSDPSEQPYFGSAVALSADGNTLIVGGSQDNRGIGAVWIFTRSGSVWTQQGSKLVGSGYAGTPNMGFSVAISADGNTAVAGGHNEGNKIGSIWVFTRSGGVWTQQGAKIRMTGGPAAPQAGSSVAMSADGNNIVVGGPGNFASAVGAIWVYTRTGSVWTQQGTVITPSDNTGNANFGISVAMSADGNTIAAGGYGDSNYKGATWVFTRTAGTWSQQGLKLQATGVSRSDGAIYQGRTLSLDAAGDGLLVGATFEEPDGAAWLFTRNGSTWTQRSKLAGLGTTGPSNQGSSCALSYDGSTAMVGGWGDNNSKGAAWAFVNEPYPALQTLKATAITSTSATLNGIVNDNGTSTSVDIEYSTSESMSGSVNASLSSGTSPMAAGAGNTAFSAQITGLQPGTNYYYRINGTNTVGSNLGPVSKFTTLTGPVVSSFSPAEAGAGAIIIITGNSFIDISAVSIGGVPAQSFKVLSLNTIYAKVAQGGASGSVTVTNSYGTGAFAGFKFLSPPVISYPGNQNYTVTVAIPTLSPTNSGGAIPNNAYAKTTTVATTNYPGTGTAAPFTSAMSTVVDPLGNVYVSDASKSEIKIVSPTKVVNRFVTFGHVSSPNGMAMDDMGNIFVADQGNHRIRKVSPSAAVTTLAGSTTIGSADGLGTAATFNSPAALAIDAQNNVYVADKGNNTIRKIDINGVVSTFAGNGAAGLVNGAGTSASFNSPAGIAIDADMNLYVADMGNHAIRKITPGGVVTTLAGNGAPGASNGVGTTASFNGPTGITLDISGNVYIADTKNFLIRKITPGGIVTTLAGIAGASYSSDGIGTAAVFSNPTSVSIDLQGNLWVTDNFRLRTIALTGYQVSPEMPTGLTLNTANGQITGTPTSLVNASYTVTGTNVYGTSTTSFNITTAIPPVAPGITFFSPFVCTPGTTVTISGADVLGTTGITIGGVPASSFSVVSPTTITAVVPPGAASGKLTATNPYGSTNLNGFIAVNPPSISYSNSSATFTVGSAGPPLTVTNSGGAVPNHLYLHSSVFAGSGLPGLADGTGSAASFKSPVVTATDSQGNVYVGDRGNQVVRKITPAGAVSTIGTPNPSGNYTMSGMVIDNASNIYFPSNYGDLLTRITSSGVASTLAGGGSGDYTNGQGSAAGFGSIVGLTIDGNNNIYAADIWASQIRKITPGGLVSRFSGTSWQGHKNGPVNTAEFYYPDQIAIDPSGTMYIGDSGNKIIRKISPAGNVLDFAGGTVGYSDGTGTTAKFNGVGDIKIDPVGNIYVTDVGNNLIRKISPEGTVTTFLGNGLLGNSDGTANTIALNKPAKLAIDQDGTMFLPDPDAHIIRKIPTTGYTVSPELPAGLSIDGTGTISGIPTMITPSTTYTITAYNLTGSSSTTVNIATVASTTPPAITSFSPGQGPPGTIITVNGSNFNQPTQYKIGGMDAILVSNTGTQIKLMVMPGATTGALSIATAAGTANGGNFTVTATGYPNKQQSRIVANDLAFSLIGEQVAISADGNTIVARDARNGGLVFYTRTSGGWTGQDINLRGIDTFDMSSFGYGATAAISADGNTVAIGIPDVTPVYNGPVLGGVYVFVKNAVGNWIQQGRRLTGTGGVPSTTAAAQGTSIAISADGNTIIEGAPTDNNNQGAVWIFSRTAGVWAQMGSKLVGTGNTGAAQQGYSVSISADGNTAMAGGITDNLAFGASWVYVRSGNTWVQQGGKLVASDIQSAALQGASVALSADGNTAIVGEKGTDSQNNGGAHIYVRRAGVWTQQSNRLDGVSYYSNTYQGTAVAISADGNTAIMGGITHGWTVSMNQNLLWIFTRKNDTWTKATALLGAGYETTHNLENNSFVSLTPDGNTAVLGSGVNAALWVFVNAGEAAAVTQPATNITTTSATLNGTATPGGESASISIQYSTRPDMANPINAVLSTGANPLQPGSGTLTYSSHITGLTVGTTYYYRISSKSNLITINGATQSFSTLPLPPTITSFSPMTAPAGTRITITGTNLGRLTGASFGGIQSTIYLGNSETSAVAYVPDTGSSGDLMVTTPGGTATLSGFKFLPAPTITASGPTTFAPGSDVVLSTTSVQGYTYQWKRNGLVISGATANSYTATQAGSYTISVSVSGYTLNSAATVVTVTNPSAPAITSFSPTTAKEGSTITITGTNFTGTTSVSFGGTAAASFSVVSPTSITAVVAAGASGSVVINNPSGNATLAGFNFVPVPAITASGPTTFNTGGNVVLTASPATGYSYQWRKDGVNITNATSSAYTATQAGLYTVAITLNGVSQTSAATAVTVTPNALPVNSFDIQALSGTCKGSQNGSIKITAVTQDNYTAVLSIAGASNTFNFTNTLNIDNLAAGTYRICISKAGQPATSQCFTVSISEPGDLSLYVASIQNNQVSLNLNGAKTYYIKINGVVYTTSESAITLPLKEGNNTLSLTSDRACQGAIEKSISFSGEPSLYPNPFENQVSVNIGDEITPLAYITIFSLDGKTVYKASYANIKGIIQLDLSLLPRGTYVLKLSTNKSDYITKIIKN